MTSNTLPLPLIVARILPQLPPPHNRLTRVCIEAWTHPCQHLLMGPRCPDYTHNHHYTRQYQDLRRAARKPRRPSRRVPIPQLKRGKLAHVQGLCLLLVQDHQVEALRHRHRIGVPSRHKCNAAQLERRSRVQRGRRVVWGGHATAGWHTSGGRCAHYDDCVYCSIAGPGWTTMPIGDKPRAGSCNGLAVIAQKPCR